MKPCKLTQEDVQKLPRNKQIMLAIFAAELVLDKVELLNKKVAIKAINTAKLYLEGKATQEDCRVAADDAYYAAANAYYAAANAYYTAAYAAYAAAAVTVDAVTAYVVWAVERASKANKEVIKLIYNYYDALLNLDKYVEEGLLK